MEVLELHDVYAQSSERRSVIAQRSLSDYCLARRRVHQRRRHEEGVANKVRHRVERLLRRK